MSALLRGVSRCVTLVAAASMAACQPTSAPDSAQSEQGEPPSAPAVAPPVPVAAHPDPLAALASADATLAANKRLVFDMWRSIVDAGHIELADEMLAEGYTQHSPVLPTGREAFKQIFSVVPRREIPELVEPPLVASIAEGNLVAMSLLERIPARDGQSEYTTTHFNLFRVEGGRLAEHWHSVRTPPGPNVRLPEDGGPQPVVGAVGAAQAALLDARDASLAANKRLVFDLWREIVESGREDLADRYVDASFVDHNPNAASGRDGFVRYFSARADLPVEPWARAPVVALVAEGDLVALATMQELPHPAREGRTYTIVWFNLFRVAGGRVVEHWDAAAKGEPRADLTW